MKLSCLEGMPDATTEKLEQCAVAIDSALQNAKESLLEIGKNLMEANGLLSDHHGGTFGEWVEERCGFSRQTAHNYLTVFREFGKPSCKRLLQLSTTEALYYLARESTPEAAIEEAKHMAQKGYRVNLAKAKELVAKQTIDGDVADESWSLSDAIETLDAAIRGKAKSWPKEHVFVLGEKLISLGEEFKEMGVTECSLKESE